MLLVTNVTYCYSSSLPRLFSLIMYNVDSHESLCPFDPYKPTRPKDYTLLNHFTKKINPVFSLHTNIQVFHSKLDFL